ncbi:MAG: universal stress protein [Proteobacteria bacterium]|nr:universal stress protein [Pseudomonadota bacterium]MBU1685894.1 universal stress protein [Pseudomonadota bacterium]
MVKTNFADLKQRDTERHLLVAVDESENSRRAVMYLADFFGSSPNVFVTLLSILPEPSEDFFAEDSERKAWLAEKKAAMEEMLNKDQAMLMDGGFPEERINISLVVRDCTSIADAILEEQAKLKCCIVVVGRRGLAHHEEFIFGSTSNKILHQAKNCAVMVVE